VESYLIPSKCCTERGHKATHESSRDTMARARGRQTRASFSSRGSAAPEVQGGTPRIRTGSTLSGAGLGPRPCTPGIARCFASREDMRLVTADLEDAVACRLGPDPVGHVGAG